MNFSDSDPDSPLPASEPILSQPSGGAPADLPHDDFANVPEDLRTPWSWGELAIFFAFVIVSLIALETILQIFLLARYHLDVNQLKHLITTNAPLAVSFQTVWEASLLLFLFLMIRRYHGAPFWSSLGWRKFRPKSSNPATLVIFCILGGIGLAILVGFVSNFANPKTHVPFEELFQSRKNIFWLMAFGILVAPAWEETIFRGYLYPVIARKFGIPVGILVTGTLFGLMHAAQLWGGWIQIGFLIFVGVVLTWVRARSGSVAASYLVHLSYNTFLFSMFFLGTHALRYLPPVH